MTENFWRGNVLFTLEGTQFYPFFFLILHQNRKITDFPRIEIRKILHFLFFFGGHKMLSNYEKLRMKAWIVFIQSKLKVFWRKYFFFFFFKYFFCFEYQQKFWRKKKAEKLEMKKLFFFFLLWSKKNFFLILRYNLMFVFSF